MGCRDDVDSSLELVVVVVVVETAVVNLATTIPVVVVVGARSNLMHHFRKSDVMWRLHQ